MKNRRRNLCLTRSTEMLGRRRVRLRIADVTGPQLVAAQRAVRSRLLAKSRKAEADRAKALRTEEEYKNHQSNGPLADLWAEFIMNGTPPTLATYLESGGQVDAQVRMALISILEDLGVGNPGGKKPWRDLTTFYAVERMLHEDRFARPSGDSKSTKPLSQKKAIELHAGNIGQELRAVELRYNRGKLVFPKSTKKSNDTPS